MSKIIIGVDEVGAGPLAGPLLVYATCIYENDKNKIIGITDSKKISPKKRAELAKIIPLNIIDSSYIYIDEKTIDQINIYEARRLGMIKVINAIIEKINNKEHINYDDIAIKIDGTNLHLDTFVSVEEKEQLTIQKLNIEYIIKGDEKEYAISLASILAKVQRDNLMIELSNQYPEYGFDKHKGYGTKLHINAIKKYGLSPIHRKTFCTKIKY